MKCSPLAWSKYSRFSPDDLRVVAQVEVAPVVDALELLPAEREAVLHVDRLLGVVGQLVRRVLAEAETGGIDAVGLVPGLALRQPLLERLRRALLRPHEVLHLHLLELAHPEHEVAGRDLVAEGLADLRDAERDLLARALLDVLEVDVRALGGLGAEVDDGALVLHRAHVAGEHQVEAARRRERLAVVGTDEAEARGHGLVAEIRLGEILGSGQLVEAVAAVAFGALDQGVAERAHVTRRDPHLGVHEDAGIQPHDVVAILDHGPPPGALDVVLELHAQGPVVPHGVDAAVDLGRGEDEAAALGQRDDRLEVGDGGRDGVRIGGGVGHEGAPRARGLGRDTGGR